MVGVQHFRNLQDRGFPVPDQADPAESAQQRLREFLYPVSLERGQQHQRYGGKVDHPADPDQPDGACQLLMHKITVQEIKDQRDDGSHGLVGDEPDCHGHGPVTHRNAGLA